MRSCRRARESSLPFEVAGVGQTAGKLSCEEAGRNGKSWLAFPPSLCSFANVDAVREQNNHLFICRVSGSPRHFIAGAEAERAAGEDFEGKNLLGHFHCRRQREKAAPTEGFDAERGF